MPPPETQKSAKIFLSYERNDYPKVQVLHRQIKAAGYDPWIDKENILPGEKWEDAIRRAIKGADFFLACLSNNSVDKRGVLQREIKFAMDCMQGKLGGDIFVIPVRLEEVDLPEGLSEYQWVDFFEKDWWARLRAAIKQQGFPGIDRAPVPKAQRESVLTGSRAQIWELIGPSYILDTSYHFLDWNPAFESLIAKPSGLRRGQHALSFIEKLDNFPEVKKRSELMFGPDKDPLVDLEHLFFPSDKYGLIHFWKIATQISDEFGNPLAWSVQLNVVNVDKYLEFWTDLESRLEQDINWSRYAVSYDQLLEPFDDYQQMLDEVVGMVGSARRCVDLGAGTGNACIKLLEADQDRDVWAVEVNESMLSYLRNKVDAGVADGRINPDRLTIIKEDILRLEELPRNYFDAAILVNVLYAVDDPKVCLDQIYRVLKPGGMLALTTPHRETDVDKLFARMQAVLEQKGKFESLKKNFQGAKAVHKKMIDRIHRDSKEDIRRYLETSGFEIDDWHEGYVGSVVVVKAIKR